MTNRKKKNEIKKEILVYSGTSIQNYVKCSFVGENDRVWFDKRREEKHTRPELFWYDDNFSGCVGYALSSAKAVSPESAPLILEGRIIREGIGFLCRENFPVDAVWVINPKVDWHLLRWYGEDQQMYFVRKDALDFLKNQNS